MTVTTHLLQLVRVKGSERTYLTVALGGLVQVHAAADGVQAAYQERGERRDMTWHHAKGHRYYISVLLYATYRNLV